MVLATRSAPRHNVHITCSGDISRHHTAVMDINVLTCHINGRVGTESNFPHDIRRTLIRRGIVVKSGSVPSFVTSPLPLILCVIAQLRSVEMVSRPLLITEASPGFLLVDAERAACINVELPHKAAIIAINSTSVLAVALTIPFPLMLLRSSPVTFLALTDRHWQYFLCLTPEYYRG